MGKKVTESEFKERCFLKFGDLYDLSNIKYCGLDKPITLCCKIHGEFTKTPLNILRTKGCPKCGGKTALTTEEFIEKANKVHNNKYDYSKVEYINKKTKVCITCPIHGDFMQTPDDHCNKPAGCPKCKSDKTIETHSYTKDDFLELANQKYSNRYNYDKVEYINFTTKICIVCSIHGEFWQSPVNHMGGTGYPRCGRDKANESERYTLDQFIQIAKSKHGKKYNYEKVTYINSQTKVKIICPEHGEFMQCPASHLSGQGCPKCILKSQSKLFEKLKESFPNEEILWEHSPEWLGRQRFDIYFPKYNIAVEYNGRQHYESIELFGGEKMFFIQQERDNLKRQNCLKNNCNFFEIKYDYNNNDYTQLIHKISYLLEPKKFLTDEIINNTDDRVGLLNTENNETNTNG